MLRDELFAAQHITGANAGWRGQFRFAVHVASRRWLSSWSLSALAMAHLRKSVVTLRIGGDDLVPDEITALLGVSPTQAQIKGQELVGRVTGNVRIAKFGLWLLEAADREPEDMDGQIQELLSQMTSDFSVWQSIAKRYEIDLFCGLFMRVRNEGLTLSPQSLVALGERGIEMGLAIYAGYDEDSETST